MKPKFFIAVILLISIITGIASCKKSAARNTPPTVTIISPTPGANVDIFSIHVHIDCADPTGLSKLSVYIEDLTSGNSSLDERTDINQKTYSFSANKIFPIITSSPEIFKLTATATDKSGNATTESVTFTAQ